MLFDVYYRALKYIFYSIANCFFINIIYYSCALDADF